MLLINRGDSWLAVLSNALLGLPVRGLLTALDFLKFPCEAIVKLDEKRVA